MSIVKTLIEQSWKVDTSLIYHGSAMGWVQNGSPELDTISKYPVILAVCISLTTVMVGIVFTRLVFRYRTRQLAADDYVMAVAMVRSTASRSLLCEVRPIKPGAASRYSASYTALYVSHVSF